MRGPPDGPATDRGLRGSIRSSRSSRTERSHAASPWNSGQIQRREWFFCAEYDMKRRVEGAVWTPSNVSPVMGKHIEPGEDLHAVRPLDQHPSGTGPRGHRDRPESGGKPAAGIPSPADEDPGQPSEFTKAVRRTGKPLTFQDDPESSAVALGPLRTWLSQLASDAGQP